MFSCCGRSFDNRISFMYHEHGKHKLYPKHYEKIYQCSICPRKFPWEISLVQHETFSQHNKKQRNKRRRKKKTNPLFNSPSIGTLNHCRLVASNVYTTSINLLAETYNPGRVRSSSFLTSKLSQYYHSEVVVATKDRKESKEKAYGIVRGLLDEVKKTSGGGEIYSSEIRNAGSTATGTKVNVADEFDFDIELNLDGFTVKHSSIPGCVKIGTGSNYKTLHLTDDAGNLVPTKLLQDFHERMKEAIGKLKLGHKVILQKKPHGPAITLTITGGTSSYIHHIDIDISPTLTATPHSIKLSSNVISRINKVFSRKSSAVAEIKEAPLILVPKKVNDWLISYSKPMKVFINNVHAEGECRKQCHKTLKYDVKKMQSEESLPGISTYIFKHHLLWFCEKTCQSKPAYWKSENFGNCYIDMLGDLIVTIKSGMLKNYFDVNSNILEGKDMSDLKHFAERLEKKRNEYLHSQ